MKSKYKEYDVKKEEGKVVITRTNRAGEKYTCVVNTAKPATPIKDKKDLYKISDFLRGDFDDDKAPVKNSEKYYVLWELSVYEGFRISDTLNLRVEDVTKPDHYIYAKKTGKRHPIIIQPELEKILTRYIKRHKLQPQDYLFYANRKDGSKSKPIDKSQAYRKLKEVVESVCPHVRFSNHTTRKSAYYQMYLRYGIEFVQAVAGHSSSKITLTYIGLSDAELKEKLLDFNPYQ